MTTTMSDNRNPGREGLNVQQRRSQTFKHQALKLPIPPRPTFPLSLPPLPRTPVEARAVDEFDPADLEKLKILGCGSGGKVYKVRHRRTQSLHALKVVQGDHDASNPRHIVREMEILRRTDSPYVVKCHGIYERGGDIQFLLEYMDGGSLDQCSPMPESFLVKVARQVLNGLEYLHAHEIVHRDLKPSNLLLNGEQEVKIADFGVSRFLATTPCHSCVGTFAYMSPERIDPDMNDGRYDGKAGDIWSLGLTLLECYVGQLPFLSPGLHPDLPTLMCVIGYEEPPSPPSSASPEFQSFIRCCLKKDANLRSTASELLTHPFVSQAGGASSASSPKVIESA